MMENGDRDEKLKGTPQIRVTIDEHGQVVEVTDLEGKPLDHSEKSPDYQVDEKKRLVGGAVEGDLGAILATVNWCKWRKINGKWRCV